MRIIREIQNAIDGKYHIAEDEKKEKGRARAGSGFREEDSRVVRKLVDLGLAIPEQGDAKKKRS